MKTRIGLAHVLLTALVAAVVSVGWSQSSHGQAARGWDYKALSLDKNGLVEDGQPRAGTPRPRLQELGQQGWELVGMTSTVTGSETAGYYVSNNVIYTYWLKRPR
jgi:hypothetical protein